MRSKAGKVMVFAPLAILGLLFFATVGGWLVMWLWNYLLPPLFGWPRLGFWQALALLALCRTLFGGWSSHSSARSRVRQRVRERIRERYEQTPPEERKKFRQKIRERWLFDPSTSETDEH